MTASQRGMARLSHATGNERMSASAPPPIATVRMSGTRQTASRSRTRPAATSATCTRWEIQIGVAAFASVVAGGEASPRVGIRCFIARTCCLLDLTSRASSPIGLAQPTHARIPGRK